VSKVLEYLAFRKTFEGLPHKEEIPVNDFAERIPLEVVLEL
jgi:hypothetical protein